MKNEIVKLLLPGRVATIKQTWRLHADNGRDNGRTSQLDCIHPGRKMDSIMTYTHNDVKLCSTWDHFPENAPFSEDEGQGYFTQQKKKKGMARWSEEARNDVKKTVMDRKGGAQKEGLETIQRQIEEAAKKVAHTTKSDRQKEAKKTPTESFCEIRGSGEEFQTY